MELALSMNRFASPPETEKKKEKKEHSQFVYFLIYHRVAILICFLLAIFLLSRFFIAYCADYQPGQEVTGAMGTLINNGGWVDTIFGSSTLSEYKNLLKITAGTNFTIGGYSISSLGNIISGINDIFSGIALGLALIFWAYSFMEMLTQTNGQMIMEQFIRKIFFLIICINVINYSLDISFAIANAGTELLLNANGILSSSTSSLNQLANALKEQIFVNCYRDREVWEVIDISWLRTLAATIPYYVDLLLPWLISWFCGIVLKFICWSRAIEICIFAAVSPIMFIDLGTTRDLTHSSTIRALKNLVSLAMQGVLIIISLAICDGIMGGLVAPYMQNGFSMDCVGILVLISILKIGTIAKTQSIAKQALGVG